MVYNINMFDKYPDMMRPEQVMEAINISRSTLYRWFKNGLPVTQISKRGDRRINKQDLKSFIKQLAVKDE